ncbi:MAG: recombination regulator RecX [Oscillospiraceae bacterium]|jgi:regulatory protein|nr:recombination regulator RecX [Oscillospiraceae bacterium]
MEDFTSDIEYSPEFERAKSRAMTALNARAMSRGELRERLMQRGKNDGITEETADAVVDWAARLGLIDDLNYARELRRAYERRGYGVGRVRQEFYRRRIPRELWDEVLDGDDENAVPSALRFIEQKLGGAAADYDTRRRITAALARRGFTWDDVKAAFAAYEEQLTVDG